MDLPVQQVEVAEAVVLEMVIQEVIMEVALEHVEKGFKEAMEYEALEN